MEWFFNGLGTSIIILIFGFITGGTMGYRIGIKKTNKINQKQIAKHNASQTQIGMVNHEK